MRRAAVPTLAAAGVLGPCCAAWLRRSVAGLAGSAAAEQLSKKERRAARLEERRLTRNQQRSKRGRRNRAERNAKARAERQAALDAMSSEEREAALARAAAKKTERRRAAENQEQRVREALASGQRICIDLSFDAAMSEKENRCTAAAARCLPPPPPPPPPAHAEGLPRGAGACSSRSSSRWSPTRPPQGRAR
jgi:hypothetical protein